MRIDKTAIVLGLAICTSAAPWGGPGDYESCSDDVVSAPSTLSATPSACRWGRRQHYSHSPQAGGPPPAWPTDAQTGSIATPQSTPAPETTLVQTSRPAQPSTSINANTPVASPTDAVTTVATSSSSSGTDMPVAPADGGTPTDYMVTVNQMRNAGGLPELTQDSTLEANAAKTCADSGGNLNHELNPGTMAQVLAPASDDHHFWNTYVGGWLCEIPSLPGLNGVCTTAGQGWSHGDETGHADILTSTSYTKIGCALGSNVWACDLA